MTGKEVLALAASHGVRVALVLADFTLKPTTSRRPKRSSLSATYKEAVVAVLSKKAEFAGEWRLHFEDHVGTVMRARSLPRPEAERAAFDIVFVEFLNATHPDTDPNRCVWCGKSETPDATLLPIGVGDRHAWLHCVCWVPWCQRRRKAAAETLAIMGIVEPPKDEAVQ